MSEMPDHALVTAFEDLALAPGDFTHREHVRLAFAMLHGADFGDAALRFRRGLQRFATAAGVPHKVHETLTWAYLAVVHECMHEVSCVDSLELLARCPELLDHRAGALARHYDVDAITRSPLARRVFVLPRR